MFINKNIKDKNLNPLYRLIIGFIFLGMAGWVVEKALASKDGITQYDWIYLAVFAITGLFFVVDSFIAIAKKAYLKIDNQRIAVKTDEVSKAVKEDWNQIEKIIFVENKIEIISINNTVQKINLSFLDNDDVTFLTESITRIAEEKEIHIAKNATDSE